MEKAPPKKKKKKKEKKQTNETAVGKEVKLKRRKWEERPSITEKCGIEIKSRY